MSAKRSRRLCPMTVPLAAGRHLPSVEHFHFESLDALARGDVFLQHQAVGADGRGKFRDECCRPSAVRRGPERIGIAVEQSGDVADGFATRHLGSQLGTGRKILERTSSCRTSPNCLKRATSFS